MYNVYNVYIEDLLCLFLCFLMVPAWSARFPVTLAHTTKLPALHYWGNDGAAQWLPSGHYEDQLYEDKLQSVVKLEQ